MRTSLVKLYHRPLKFLKFRNMGTYRNTLNLQEEDARKIFLAGVNSVIPSELVRSKVRRRDNILTIVGTENVSLDQFTSVNVVGFGKAVLPMAEEMIDILQGRLNRCIVSVPEGTRESSLPAVEINRGAKDNIPDENAASAANKIVQLVESCKETDLLIVLISGGGSALLPAPKPPITIEEKGRVIKALSRSGATINELNTVRRKLSLVKGGGLVQICKSKKIISLILSDVLGDPLNVIASGPTVQNTDDAQDALNVVNKYIGDLSSLPESVQNVLHEDVGVQRDFSGVQNFIIGNNTIALQQASVVARELKYEPLIVTSRLEGEARLIGEKLAVLASLIGDETIHRDKIGFLIKELHLREFDTGTCIRKYMQEFLNNLIDARRQRRDLCLLLGGETTVKVIGNGIGGRNQELALSAACQLHHLKPKSGITILSAGTDGIDGPCDMAGAVVNSLLVQEAIAQTISPADFLDNNDTYNFYKQVFSGHNHVHTGHTGTNVCDIILILISHKVSHCTKSRI
ncbi:unnamed protein product [Allacma fusca]|uniref:Glycerate kinase n=1 Tax=Allacma fusca TaxID=39272 RepID=A0A8J2KMX8_9HEXA|nr:unnamed protein product [Allacma fusca]